MSYKIFLFIIILILFPKFIHAQLYFDMQHSLSNDASPGIFSVSIIIINHSGFDMDYASSSLNTGEWIIVACNPENFQTITNGQTLNIAAISTKEFIGYSGMKGSIIYNVMNGPSPTPITFH
ncbi:hypothetical protein RCL_jg11790.t1 [Rhizophagus clarus]|uniref:Uncharacterized protein n=1 Tax=Rhizophagus clarus TaxID=94130 RepID=A0A8H3MCJ7_9GLOM|nr:hypothetical protein RCL_jg11790.t1 [Rhizophagus clarus]